MTIVIATEDEANMDVSQPNAAPVDRRSLLRRLFGVFDERRAAARISLNNVLIVDKAA